MGYLSIFTLIVLCLVIRGQLNDLKCYKCEDCGNLDDSQVVSCHEEYITTVAPSPSPSPISSSTFTSTSQRYPTDTTPTIATTLSTGPEEIETDKPTTDESVTDEPVTDQEVINLKQSYDRFQAKRDLPGAFIHFYCYSYDRYENGTWKTNKGCVATSGNKTGCEMLNVEEEHCWTCTEDRCNKSSVIRFSLVIILIALVMAFSLQ